MGKRRRASARGIAATFELVVQYWFAFTNRHTSELQRSDAETGAIALARFVEETRARLVVLEGAAQRDARLEGLLLDHQFWRLQKNYAIEWMREPMDERRRMLEFAAAHPAKTGLTLGQLVRVERTLRELDPADIDLLYRLDRLADPDFVQDPKRNEPVETQLAWHLIKLRRALARANENALERAVLEASGCFTTSSGGNFSGPIAHVTPVGQLVLGVLDEYATRRAAARA